MVRSRGVSSNRRHVDPPTTSNMAKGSITDRIGLARPFLDRVLDRRTGDSGLLGIIRR